MTTEIESYEFLKSQVTKYNDLYYKEGKSIISDMDYDELLVKLQIYEKANNINDPDSPTNQVGCDIIESFSKQSHDTPMLSIENSYNYEDMKKYNEKNAKKITNSVSTMRSISYIATPKIDGMAISLKYKGSILESAITRGNGHSGDVVTHNILKIDSIPKKIPWKTMFGTLEIRGEIYMKNSEFERINSIRKKNNQELFKNPRNAVAGLVKSLDSSKLDDINLSFFGYSVPTGKYYTYQAELQTIKSIGFDAIPFMSINDMDKSKFDEISIYFNTMKKDYNIDGIVFKLNDNSFKDILGYTSKHPNYLIAYKYPTDNGVETTLLDIEYSVGKFGTVTPIAIVKPVLYKGTTISKCTLHNFDNMRKLDIKINDKVILVKAGEIIPQIISVNTSKRDGTQKDIKIPTDCISCGEKLDSTDLKNIKCVNESCRSIFIHKMRYLVSNKCFNMVGISESLIAKLYDKKYIKNEWDIFTITKDKLLTLDGIKDKLATKVINIIEGAKQAPFEIILNSLGIHMVGNSICKILAKKYESIESLLTTTYDDLISIDGLGEIHANEIVNALQSKKVVNQIKFYIENDFNLAISKPITKKGSSTVQSFNSAKFCITGTLSQPRNSIVEFIENNDGTISSSVTKNTDYLLIGSKPSPSKVKKAEDINIKIITEEDLMEML